MYCPRCNIEVGNDEFCENCGGKTVPSIEEADKVKNVPEPIKEKINRINNRNTEIAKPEFKVKKLISMIVIAVIVIGGLIGYNTLKSQYTPEKVTQRYFNYLAKKDYKDAYKLLVDTDDYFLSEPMFEKAMSAESFKTYTIKSYNQADFNQSSDANMNGKQLAQADSYFEVNCEGNLYPIGIIKKGKKFMFFDDYKILADNLTTSWTFTAPKGTKILVNGKEPKTVQEADNSGSLSLANYNPENVNLEISQIFKGSYDVTASMDGAINIKYDKAVAGKDITVKYSPTDILVNSLKDVTEQYLKLHFSNATKDKFSSIVASDNQLSAMTFEQAWGGSSDNGIKYTLKDITVTDKSIDDSSHAKISIDIKADYEDDTMVSWGGSKQTGTKDINTDIYFEKQNGKWLIYNTGSID